ncbi:MULTISPECIES: lytic transglycosylase domain-containing protein [unclassified Nocardioides]|uniref:lytic transglycosylase domain-containing protein n=1 Tax=unclassified Nocardioides TaxID=2615069 RepID=UPI0009F0101B|nr:MULTISPECIES: lytic transglycosylase domain-containing protein [unclassified Nocardioides]GAW49014.1 membrane-bound lytic murein transglycosylase B-like protein [Nocardioides sp. PD653-B2]GAW57214.1 membrane-bound lytic murein transglycosylase B-like protein [Nocardioides sp. PD653]
MTAARLIVLLATGLLAVTGLGYLASQTVLAPPPLVASSQQQYVGAPAPVPAPAAGGRHRKQAAAAPVRVDSGWVTATAAKAGIPEPAVRAYADAQLNEPDGCDVGWTTLAGIGWVESQHGTIDGRTLGDDGRSSTPILGPALNGKGAFAAIPATPESSAWHGDPAWDHAVGPLQFIPSTWETWRSDGDGDGVADPNDLDDAAYAAVRYLCADGHDLTTGAGWADAVLSYNHAQSYVDAVHAAATAYAERTG